ncbi:hypothetical protein C8R46DRAFT_440921 [Mycena filopes]|nr:hypothetical protein C8R46DRAFT_440921 [Mycena filopes]
MPAFDDFPPEISLQIFPNMRLKGLISARGVSKRWRELISLADIHPTRLTLLRLYQQIVHDPLFLRTRPWTLENLRPFDRQAYIDALLAQHNYIPDDFRFWILEWPARAAIACAWPGLPDVYVPEGTDEVERISGCNFLGRIPPLVHRVTLDLMKIGPPDVSSDGDGDTEYFFPYPNKLDFADEVHPDEVHSHRDSNAIAFDHSDEPAEAEDSDSGSEGYFHTHEEFRYSPPPWNGHPVDITFPALLVWERDDCQSFLALAPDTPFAVYLFNYGMYETGQSRQHTSWISWLEAQLRRIHRQAAKNAVNKAVRKVTGEAAGDEQDSTSDPPYVDEDGQVILEDVDFESESSYFDVWTAEDEAHFNAAA